MFYSLDELLDMLTDKVKYDYGCFTDDDKYAICLRIDQLKEIIAAIIKKHSKNKQNGQ